MICGKLLIALGALRQTPEILDVGEEAHPAGHSERELVTGADGEAETKTGGTLDQCHLIWRRSLHPQSVTFHQP